MSTEHVHAWTVTELVDDYVPGIPAYVTWCACGVLKPHGVPVSAAA